MSVPSSPNPMASMGFPSMVHERIEPNPHPYAIRTTSTGLLSRSNSSGRNITASHHHYIPVPPSPTKQERKGHRPARSLTSSPSLTYLKPPQPLPVPADFKSNAKHVPRRVRAETLPTIMTTEVAPVGSLASAELPANPKLWTVSQVSSYILNALRVPSRGSGYPESLPPAIVHEVAAMVQEAKINGRLFLRLNDEDLDRYILTSVS